MSSWLVPSITATTGVLIALITALFSRSKDRRQADNADRRLTWDEVQDLMTLKDRERDYWHAQATEARAALDEARKDHDDG